MIISFTGHRPNKLPDQKTGYDLNNPTNTYIANQIENKLLGLKPEKIISGMALGVDTIAANVAVKLNIPFIAAIPFIGQESKWPEKSQKIYRDLLCKASEKIIVSSGSYTSYKMQIRNQYMVDNSDILIAVFDGSSGGTKNCVDYAISKNKQIIYINPKNTL